MKQMKLNRKHTRFYIALYVFLFVMMLPVAYGLVDLNLPLPGIPVLDTGLWWLEMAVRANRPLFAGLYVLALSGITVLYLGLLRQSRSLKLRSALSIIGTVIFLSLIVFPWLSYDIFNYITTAKVAFHYHENPYVVMPVEIPNEPNLAFTRAANKVALYGPVWLGITAVPSVAGLGNIWLTVLTFKLVTAVFYVCMLKLIYDHTKHMANVLFFALNPLIINEVLISGHNDIVMAALSVAGILYAGSDSLRKRVSGWGYFIASILVKGASAVLLPILFLRRMETERKLLWSTMLMFGVFIVAGPLREELYPWYAVWFLAFLALLPLAKYRFLTGFAIVFSVALELRHVPYMLTGDYAGPGPVLRIAVTVVPVILYFVWWIWEGKHETVKTTA